MFYHSWLILTEVYAFVLRRLWVFPYNKPLYNVIKQDFLKKTTSLQCALRYEFNPFKTYFIIETILILFEHGVEQWKIQFSIVQIYKNTNFVGNWIWDNFDIWTGYFNMEGHIDYNHNTLIRIDWNDNDVY